MSTGRDVVYLIKRSVPRELKERLKASFGVPSISWSLTNMKRNGFNPAVVIDVGAYQGDWTRLCKRLFPNVRILMVEPQPDLTGRLRRVAAEYPSVDVAPVLLGATEHHAVPFYVGASASSVLPDSEGESVSPMFLPMTTLSALVDRTPFARPDFIKLDVQGYELEVLKGAPDTLRFAEVVLMEVSLIEINKDAPLFKDVVNFMATNEFHLYDLCTFMRRPYDLALWQIDAIFVKMGSDLLATKRWA